MSEELVSLSDATTQVEPARVDRHPVAVYLARLSIRTRRTAQSVLKVLASLASDGRADLWNFPWQQLRYQHMAAIRSKLAANYAPGTANRMIAILRGVLSECWQLGYISAEDYHRAAKIPPVKGERLPKGRALSAGELRALFAVCSSDPRSAGRRDAALLAVLYGCGLRRSEAVGLDLSDYDIALHTLKIRAGKGNKDRMAYVTGGAQRALEDWLRVRGAEAGPLFVRIGKGDRLTQERLTDQAVMVILRRRGQAAGVAAFSPHDLRRTFIGDLLDAGADISTVQHLAGHANVQTTARYDRRGEAAKKKAANLLHVPYEQ